MSDTHRLSTTTTTSKSSFTAKSTTASKSSSTLTRLTTSTTSPSPPNDKLLPSSSDIWDFDENNRWQDMPIVHTDELRGGLDEEDSRRHSEDLGEAVEAHNLHPTTVCSQKVEMTKGMNNDSSTRPDPTISQVHHPYMLLNDLFLILIADSMYDSRSRFLLSHVGFHLSLSWWVIIVFEGSIGKACKVT
ncbi:MAG: hypothetical protein NXY57DRAFT_965326 [Lentinula lateritia]|nr:MAG: hypothetical protein NXY57DRAFT_965326 [Lentinula lateritia]